MVLFAASRNSPGAVDLVMQRQLMFVPPAFPLMPYETYVRWLSMSGFHFKGETECGCTDGC